MRMVNEEGGGNRQNKRGMDAEQATKMSTAKVICWRQLYWELRRRPVKNRDLEYYLKIYGSLNFAK